MKGIKLLLCAIVIMLFAIASLIAGGQVGYILFFICVAISISLTITGLLQKDDKK